MRKQKTNQNTNQESTTGRKRDFRQIRNSIAMVAVSICLLTTATYAWFTLSNQPSVEGLAMTASTTEGLQISKEEGTGYANQINVTDPTQMLSPVTCHELGTFEKPVYSGDTVASTTNLFTETNNEVTVLKNYVATYTYYLKSTASGAQGVSLLGGTNGTKLSCANPTYGGGALRVAFKIDSNNWKIFEPNNDIDDKTGTKAPSSLADNYAVTPDITQNSTTFQFNSGTNVSDELFTINANDTTAHKVVMYVWIEGTDDQCVDEIKTKNLTGKIQFTTTAK